jgi:GntR family transcriptional regulator / MocR family aminotransferase
MAKRTTAFELALPPRDARMSAYRWLYQSLRADILDNRLRPGARLPATRDLARQYGLSRGTIVNAFEQLKSEGYVEGSVGSGTYVSKVLPEELLHIARGRTPNPSVQPRRRSRLSDYGRRVKLFRGYESRSTRAFRPNLPALDLFPMTVWTQIMARCLRRVSTKLLMGCDALGHLPLRQAVAEYLSTSRGVKCVAEQVAIVSGVQEALDLVARLFVNPGDRVCMENPGYTGASLVFEAFGAKISAAHLDEQGITLDHLPSRARLLYVTPGHQFPLGTTMSLARRLQLLEWARKSGAVIFEDDYDSEYRYSGRPIPALQGLDRSGLVLYAGSFSKVLFPSLRLGYLVIPSDLLNHFEAIKSLTNRHAPLLEQVVLTAFITEGHFGRHLRRMREVYAERLSVLLDCARQSLYGLLEISNVEAGLQTAGWLCTGIDAESASAAASRRHVDVTPISRYSRGHRVQGQSVQEGLQLGFAAVDTQEIRRGVQELAIALEGELNITRRKSDRERGHKKAKRGT